MNCTIVIATYNRKELFERTLSYVKAADYSGFENINLVISIDHAKNCDAMKTVADTFSWKHGKKTVILHEERQGLRKHFIFCGSLSQEYGPVIFLEDDVIVNRYYYQTAMQLTKKYIENDRIVGASLYTMSFNETAQRPFQALEDGNDVFFCSLMSWAPVYFPKQWAKFAAWLGKLNGEEIVCENVPQDVATWPNSSFKKLHIQYVQQNKLYFAYTRHSCATNFSEPGEHYKKDTNKLQVSMEVGRREKLQLCSLEDSLSVYDAFLELDPEVIKKLCPDLMGYDFDVDLYGKKPQASITKPFVLTTKKTKGYVKSYGRKMVPQEMNIIRGISGTGLFLAKREDIHFGSKGLRRYVDDMLYDIKGSTVLKILISDVMWSKDFVKSRVKK